MAKKITEDLSIEEDAALEKILDDTESKVMESLNEDDEKPTMPIKEEPKEVIILSLKEFMSTLSGSDVLLASAMNKIYQGQKLTLSTWTNALKNFGSQPA